MPTYDYRCKACGATHQIEHGYFDERPTTCPTCGGPLVRIFHAVGLVFKGSGFHKTDYASAATRAASAEPKKPDAKTGEQASGKAKAETKSASADDSKHSG